MPYAIHAIAMRRFVTAAALILITSAGWLFADGPVAQPFSALAIKDAKIVFQPGKVIEQGNIIIRDGVIKEAGKDAKIPYDAEIIEAKGLTAYAGWIDAGARIGLSEGRKSKSGSDVKIDVMRGAMSSTPEVSRKGLFPEFDASEAVQIGEKDAENWRKAGFTAVQVIPPAALLAGETALVALSDDARRDTIILRRAALAAGWTASGDGYPRSLMGSIAHMRQAFLDAQYYQACWDIYRQAKEEGKRPPADPAMEALQPVLRGEMPILLPASRLDEVDRALRFAGEFKLRPVVFGGHLAFKRTDRLKETKTPVLLAIDLPEKPKPGAIYYNRLRDVATRYGKEIPKELEEKAKKADKENKVPEARRAFEDRLARWNERAANPRALLEAGIPFALMTDGHKEPKDFFKDLATVIEEGKLPADAALAALTLAPARLLGLEKHLGSIEPGKMAHVTLLEGEFGKKESKVRLVVSDGRKFDYRGKEEEKKKEGAEGEKKDEAKEEKKEGGKKEPEKGADAKTPAALTDRAVETDEDRVPSTHTGGRVLIRNASVLTVTQGSFESLSILIENGRIAALGKNIEPPPGVTVIDGAGAWVMPGIVDCHSHTAIDGGINEFTDSITAQCRIPDVIRGDDVNIYRASAGGLTTANILHGSANTIGGQRAIIQFRYNQPAMTLFFPGFPPGIKFALGENVTRSATRFPNTRMGVEAVIRRAFMAAREYREGWNDYEKLSAKEKKKTAPPRRDLRLEALAEVLSGERWIHCHSYNQDEIMMVVSILRDFGVNRLTLEHGLEAFKVAPELADFGAYVSTFADNWAYKIEAYDAIPYNAPLLNEAGVKAILNSDSDERARRLYIEAAKMLRYGGMTADEALATITRNPALALGIADKAGSIEVGMKADVALFNGHPLNAYSRCFLTLIDGEVVFERKGDRGGPFPLELAKEKDNGKQSVPVSLTVEASPRGVYAITNAFINPVSSPRIAKGTVVVADGKIVSVGEGANIPEGATIIDARGLRVYPGLIDAGSTLGLNEIAALTVTKDSAEAGVIQPDLRAAVAVKPDSEIIPVTRFTGITTAVASPVGGLISGQSALIQLAGWTPAEMTWVDTLALAINVPEGIGGVSAMELFEEGERKKTPTPEEQIKQLKDLFAKGREYARMKDMAAELKQRPPPYQPDLEAIIPYIKKTRPVVIACDGAPEILAAISLAKDLDVRAILRGCGEGWKVAKEIAESKLPVILGPIAALPEDFYDPYDAPFANAARLHEAGIKFCFQSGSDSDSRNLPFDVALTVAFGLPKDVALRAVTLTTAEILGVADRAGSLEAGKRADLILTDGDPLQPTTNVRGMLIAGRPVDVNDNKHTQLYDKYRKRLKP